MNIYKYKLRLNKSGSAVDIYYRGDPKKFPTFSESNGISLQIQDDISIKWGIFFGPPCIMPPKNDWKVVYYIKAV